MSLHPPTTLASLTPGSLPELNAPLDPPDIVQWAAATFAGRLIMTSSFGIESMCSIHLAISAQPQIKILFINTGYLFPETLAFMEQMRNRFNLNVLEFHSQNNPITWLTIHNEPDPAHRNNVDACCAANKNEVIDRAMRQLAPAAWLRGIRADQSAQRSAMDIVQWSARHQCYAISPILRWDKRQIHAYMKAHDLPYHPLWEKGYTSLGCNPLTCTQPLSLDAPTDDSRSGRWPGLAKKECGIHLDSP